MENETYKVLLADDPAFSRAMVTRALADTAFSVVAEAGNGREAVEQFSHHQPDIVLLDVTMPEVTGPEALQQILELNASAKVVMLSSIGMEDTITECLTIGAQAFIQKPADKETILQQLNALVQNGAAS